VGPPDVHRMQDSLWYASAPPAPAAPPLAGAVRADVAIIGGGFTGCSAALHLAQAGARVVLLEADEIGFGGSGRNAGLVNAGLWLDPDEVERRVGPEHGARLVAALGDAPKLVFALIERYAIACDLRRHGVMRVAHSAGALAGLKEHAAQWLRRGVAAIEVLERAATEAALGSPRYCGAIIDHRSATIQPLGYVRGLAGAALTEGAALHGGTRALAIERAGSAWCVRTARGAVSADHVIVATNAYSDELWPGLRQSTIPIGCFMFATEPLGPNRARLVLPAERAVYDTQRAMYFARLDRDRRLILGSLGYPTGRPAGGVAWPRRVLARLFPQLGEVGWDYHWSGTIGFTPDHIPRLHEPAPGVLVALGYNGRGIAPGTFLGSTLAKRALGLAAGDLPLPVTPVRPIALRALRQRFYQTAFRGLARVGVWGRIRRAAPGALA